MSVFQTINNAKNLPLPVNAVSSTEKGTDAVSVPVPINRIAGGGGGSEEPAKVNRAPPDGESLSFLRQKEAELKLRRERERALSQQQQEGNSGGDVGGSTAPTRTVGATPVGVSTVPLPRQIKTRSDDGDATFIVPSGASGLLDFTFVVSPTQAVSPGGSTSVISPGGSTVTIKTPTPEVIDSNTTSSSVVPRTNKPSTIGSGGGVSNSVKQSGGVGDVLPAAALSPQTAGQIPKSKSLQRGEATLSRQSSTVPQFYYPLGRPSELESIEMESMLRRVKEVFDSAPDGKCSKQHMGQISKV